MQTPRLHTERLTLREVRVEDVKPIFDCWMQDEDVSRYMSWKSSDDIHETEDFVNYELSMLQSDLWYRWIIIDNATKKLIGTCLIYFNDEEKAWDISYNLGKAYWGKGYITEAMQRVLAYAKKELKIKRMIAVHATMNPASGKVIKKLGFQFVKEIPYECNGGTIQTTGYYYSLTL